MTVMIGHDQDRDSRPDLVSDRVLWDALFQAAEVAADCELSEILHCLRDAGAALEADTDYGLVIRPGECPRAEYEAFRAEHLAPRRAEITALLLKASVVVQVKALEARLLSLGWTSREIWAEETWDDGAGKSQSLYATLAGAIRTWSGASVQVGAISAESAEIIIGGRSMRLYRVSPAVRPPEPCEPPGAKKEAV